MRHQFPLDVEAIHAYGVDAWQRDCTWPVAEPEFATLCDRIEHMYARAVQGFPGILAQAVLVKHALAVEYWHFLHAVMVIDRVRRAGRTPTCSASAPWYHQLLTDALGSIPNGVKGKSLAASLQRSARHRVMQTMKCLAWTARLNATARTPLFPRRTRETLVSIGVPAEQGLAYAARSSRRLAVSWAGDWVSDGVMASVTPSVQRGLANVVTMLMDELRVIAGKHHTTLSPAHMRYLRTLTEHQLADAIIALQSIRPRNASGSERLLLCAPGDQFGRALALRFRQYGRPVTSVAHGGSLGLFDSPTMSVNEFAVSDEFATMTEGSAALFHRILDMHPPLGGRYTRIVSSAYGGYERTFVDGRTHASPRVVRRVMLVGYPHAPWRRPQGTAQFAPYILTVEHALIRALREGGYEVVYKAHPDRLREATVVFGPSVPIIVGDVREDVHGAADAYVFSSIRTTAFSFALCTSKPIVGCLVEPDRYPLFSDVRALLARRCALLPLTFDDRGHLQFERSVLLDALAAPPVVPDTSFVEQFLFPSYAASPHSHRDVHRDTISAR